MTGAILYILIFWEFLETINHLKKPYSRDTQKYTRSSLWCFALCFYPIKFCHKYNSVFILACYTSILEYFLVSSSSFLSFFFQTISLRTFSPLIPSSSTFYSPSLHIYPLLQPSIHILSTSTLFFNLLFTFSPLLPSSPTLFSSLLQPSIHLVSSFPFFFNLLLTSFLFFNLLFTLSPLLPSSLTFF